MSLDHIKIVPMSEEHIAALAAIEQQCFSTPWSAQSLREELEIPSAVFRVALVDGTVAGYMGMQDAGDVAYVCNIAVSPDYRRQGVATALIEAQCENARLMMIRELSLEVRTSNREARALYEKIGFQYIGTRPHFYSHPSENAEIYTLYL